MAHPAPTISAIEKRKQLPFWLFTIGAIIALTLPVLIQDGMFQDAMLYTDVAHNMAHGIGTFWMPQYSKLNIAGIPSFHEQPPLIAGIQSLFFRALGDSRYVERFYVLVTLVVSALLIVRIWKAVFRNNEEWKALGWLPLLLWIAIPVCFWSYAENMDENTMGIFTLAAVLTAYKAQFVEKGYWWRCVLAGVFVFLATFSKGIPGFFPIAVPAICWLCYRGKHFGKAVGGSMTVAAVPLLIYLVLFHLPVSGESLRIYFYQRLLHRIDVMPTADYRLEIMWRLFCELLPPLFIVAIVSAVGFFKRHAFRWRETKGSIMCFLLIGLAGSIPLTFTMVQKGFYLVPSLPYFGIALAALIAPVVARFLMNLRPQAVGFKVLMAVISLFLCTTLVFTWMQRNGVSREQETIHDVYIIGSVVPRLSAVTVPVKMYDEYDFVLQGFLIRYFNISLDPNGRYPYCVALKSMAGDVPAGYHKVELPTEKYDLYMRD